MSNQTAIDTLERRLANMERTANALIEVINDLRREDGLPPRPAGPFGGGAGFTGAGNSQSTPTTIKADTFYGKKLQTAVREYLEMRMISTGSTSPATPREIYDAITTGGYQFDTKDENVALVGLRALLRKRTAFFHRLPNGTYGLTSWYPDAKKPKQAEASGESEDDDDDEAIVHAVEAVKETATATKADAAS